MSKNPLGWDYPAGAENDLDAPWNQEWSCELCEQGEGDCDCPECKDCGETGNLVCEVNGGKGCDSAHFAEEEE